jgi:hypothetical protein
MEAAELGRVAVILSWLAGRSAGRLAAAAESVWAAASGVGLPWISAGVIIQETVPSEFSWVMLLRGRRDNRACARSWSNQAVRGGRIVSERARDIAVPGRRFGDDASVEDRRILIALFDRLRIVAGSGV